MDLDLKQTKINVASKVAPPKTETCLPFSNGLCMRVAFRNNQQKRTHGSRLHGSLGRPRSFFPRAGARDWIGFHPAIVAQVMVDIFVAKNPAATVFFSCAKEAGFYQTHRINVWYISLYIYHTNQLKVGKYIIHGSVMGKETCGP